MEYLLALAGLGGLLIAIVSLIRPNGRPGLVNRPRASALLGASCLAILAGGAIAQGPAPNTSPVQVETTARSTADATTTTAVGEDPELRGSSVNLLPPASGPSGDPDQPGPDGVELVTVLSVIDGDTVTVALSDGGSDIVRLIGINTPEFGECFADVATDVLTALAPPGSQVGMTRDISDRDRFERLLRYLWVGHMSVNEELVRRGAAVARRYQPDTAMANRFVEAQSQAKSAELGLWAPDACG